MIVDIFYDTACPWCWISFQHLLTALQQWQGEPITLQWHPYLLNTKISPKKPEFHQLMKKRKILQTEELNQLYKCLQQQKISRRIRVDFNKIRLGVNTKLSHQLVILMPEEKKASMVEKIYRSFFEKGLNIGDRDILLSIAEDFGMNIDEVKRSLFNQELEKQIIKDTTLARLRGIMNVPFFIINKQFKIYFSQSPNIFILSLNRASFISSLNPPYYH